MFKTATLIKTKICLQDQLLLNASQKYCRMLHSVKGLLSTFIKLPIVINIFVLSIFEWPFYTGFTVYDKDTLLKEAFFARNFMSRV